MLRAGQIVSILEKLPYDAEIDFIMKAGSETEVLYDEGNNTKTLFSDCEKIIINNNGKRAAILLECGM